jgi:hypothetical protein
MEEQQRGFRADHAAKMGRAWRHSFRTMRAVLFPLVLAGPSTLGAKDYVVPANDVAGFFATLPDDATRVVFSAAKEYRCDKDIVLPPRRLLVIDGAGCRLVLGANSNGFTTEVPDQETAMKRTSNRYLIRDFSEIHGGRKAIDLKATLGSTVREVRLSNQSEAAIDLRFCLMCRLEQVLVTNPAGRGIVLRQGDWPGATATNSQCNSTVLEQCRVYCTKTTTQAFAVHNSGGVMMRACISEGGPPEHDLFLSGVGGGDEQRVANNPVVKSFRLENFHVEHKARVASIHVNMPVGCSVVLNNVYWNGPQEAPVILYVSGDLTLEDIAWFRPDFRIHTRNGQPRITALRCSSHLLLTDRMVRGKLRTGVVQLVDPLPGHAELKTTNLRGGRAEE